MKQLFVYGTLTTGRGNWKRHLAPQIGRPATVRGLRLIEGPGFPYAMWTGLVTDVAMGEVFQIKDRAQLNLIDWLEGFWKSSSDHYWRVIVRTSRGRAWTYIAAGNEVDGPPIRGMLWRPEEYRLTRAETIAEMFE